MDVDSIINLLERTKIEITLKPQ